MNLYKFLGFCIIIHFVKSEDYADMIKSVIKHFQSRSVIFIINEGKTEYNFLKLRKNIYFNDELYFVSYMTQANFMKVVKMGHHGGKKTVVVLEFNDRFLNGSLATLSKKSDISTYKWLILSSNYNLKNFESLRIPVITEFIIACGNSNEFNLTEIYEVEKGRKLSNYLGVWDSESLKISSQSLFQRRKDFKNAVVKVVSPSKGKFLNTNVRYPCDSASFALGVATIVLCIHKQVWDTTAEMLNAKTKIIVVPELNENTIENINAELTLRSAPMYTRHLDTRTFTWPVFGTKLAVLASYIGQDVEWKTYIWPFSYGMWLVLFIWILIGDLILALAEFAPFFIDKSGKPFLTYYNKYSFVSIFAFCNQGVSDVPKSSRCRFIFFLMFAVPAVLVPGYSGVLTSFITVQLPKMPFRNLEELSRTKDYDLGWHKSFPFQMMFNLNDTRPLNKALLANNVLPADKMPETDAEAVEKMCNEKFTFISNINTIIALKPKCRYFKLDHHFLVVYTAVELKKNLGHRHFINHCLRDIQSSGIFERSVVNFVMKFIKPSDLIVEHTEEVSAIMMENCVLPFAVLLLSMSISGFFFILELLWFKPIGD